MCALTPLPHALMETPLRMLIPACILHQARSPTCPGCPLLGVHAAMSLGLQAHRTRSEPPMPGVRAGWKEFAHAEDAAAEALARKYTAVWQVQIDQYGTWLDYDSHHCGQLEKAWAKNAPGIRLGTHDWPAKWSVDLHRMKQTNSDTEKVRLIRRVLVTNS